MNRGVGIPNPAPMHMPDTEKPALRAAMPGVADPPAKLR